MKGRLHSALWLLVAFDVAALFAVMLLAFYGGQRAHTAAGLTDVSGLNILVFLAFVVVLGASLFTWIVFHKHQTHAEAEVESPASLSALEPAGD